MEKLKNFPIMFYAMIMGLCGLALSYQKLMVFYGLPAAVLDTLKYGITALFLLISLLYVIKLVRFFDKVKAEFNHPIKISFFATLSISMLLLAALWHDNDMLYQTFFRIGLVLQTLITFVVVSAWFERDIPIKMLNSAWFIPIVGNLIVPIAYQGNSEFLWYYFSVGMFFWFALFAIIFYRTIFHEKMAKKFMPTFFILIAPPSIAFLDYVKMVELDNFAVFLINVALFFTFLMLFLYKNFLKLPFFMSWWAFTFPMAAITIALTRMYGLSQQAIYLNLAVICFCILIFFILLVGIYTVKNIFNGSIFADE